MGGNMWRFVLLENVHCSDPELWSRRHRGPCPIGGQIHTDAILTIRNLGLMQGSDVDDLIVVFGRARVYDIEAKSFGTHCSILWRFL
jgi:hypothetical protein